MVLLKRKFTIGAIVLGIILILLGISIPVYKSIFSSNQEAKEQAKIITRDYETFKEEVDLFNEERIAYYQEVVDNLYVESVENEYQDWSKRVASYSNSVDQVEQSSENLKELCVKYYSDKELSNKCKSFVIAYETVMNYYTKDINAYNDIIGAYNNSVEDYKKLEIFPSKYNYTDINEDGNFIGKD